jgi:hypothetical protein
VESLYFKNHFTLGRMMHFDASNAGTGELEREKCYADII